MGRSELVNEFTANLKAGTLKYSVLKDAVATEIISLTKSFRERRRMLLDDKTEIIKELILSTEKAREKAIVTIKEVKNIIGISGVA